MWSGRMRSTVTITAALALTVGLAGLAARAETALGRTVHDAANQITIDVPAGWTVQTPSGNIALKATAPAAGKTLPDSVDVVVRSTLFGMNTSEACEQKAMWVTQHLGHIAFTTLSAGPATVNGYPAYLHVYTWNASTGEMRWSEQVCVVKQGRAYVLTGTTADTVETIAVRSEELRQIIDSFTILPQATAPAELGGPSPARGH